MAPSLTPSRREIVARLTEHAVAASEAFDRPDLADRLRALDQQVRSALVRVLVVGEYKQGKTSLINAVAGARVCSTAPDAAALVPVAVAWGEDPAAVALVLTGQGLESRSIDLESLSDWAADPSRAAGDCSVRGIEVRWPSDQLRDGLVLIDCPDAGGLGSFVGALVLEALPFADAVLFVSDAGQELTASELGLFRRLATMGVPLALVKTRTDIHPDWHRVFAADARHVSAMAHMSFAVSSELCMKGWGSGDAQLADESAIPELLGWLSDDVVQGLDRRRAIAAASEVERVALALETPFLAERAALDDPGEKNVFADRLARAEEEANRVRSAAGRWRQVLVDVFADISGDLDHDLRSAARRSLRVAEAAIDGLDPATDWERYEPQFRRELAALVADHYAHLQARVAAAGERVAVVFSDDAETVRNLASEACPELSAGVDLPDGDALALSRLRRRRIADQALTMLRSSYGGALMAGFVGGVLGLAVATPAVLAVGLALGAKGVRDDNLRQLTQRRAEARTAARKVVDELVFAVAKDSRDRVRVAERSIRDFFADRAAELSATASANAKAVRLAGERDAASEAERRRDIDAELERLEWLVERSRDLRDVVAREVGES